MEHPKLLIEFHQKMNEVHGPKEKIKSTIRYFSTVIYVIIAQIEGLTKEIDNYDAVLKYFEGKCGCMHS